MDRIDWSKAPEGATHGVKLNDHSHTCWYKDMDFNGYCYKYTSPVIPSHKRWGRSSGAPAHGPLIPRPQPDNKEGDSVEWDGEGLPPAGVECEYKRLNVRYRSEFIKVNPIFFSDQICVLEHAMSGNQFAERLEDCEFRPIKSHRDKVKEAGHNVLDNSVERHCDDRESILDELYDAGMLKLPGDEQ